MKIKRKTMMAFLASAVLCVFAVFASQYSVSAEEEGASYTCSKDGVTVTLSIDKKEYKAGEEIHYTMTLENGRENWEIAAFSFEYGNTEGLTGTSEGGLSSSFPKVLSGETAVISGTLIGSEEVFGATAATSDGSMGKILPFVIAGAAAVVIVIFAVILIKKGGKNKRNGIKAAALILITGMLIQAAPVNAADEENVILRPYIKFTYAGQEVCIRAVLSMKMSQQLMEIAYEDRLIYKKITCHDPSVFRDKDGTYYIYGTHITGGYSTDLYNWTSVDSQLRASFTEAEIAKIREWNKDSASGDWYGYLWAPDIIYNETMQKYCMYLSANGDDWKSNIVLLTSDTVDGPFAYAGSVVYGGFTQSDYKQTDLPKVIGDEAFPERYVTNGIANRKWGTKWPNCIDPCVFYDEDGKLWMSYGSWSGGIFMLELDEKTGLRDYNVTYATDKHSDAYFGKKIAGGEYVSGEASYIQHIGDYYYLFMSYGNLEAAGGYNVRVFRSDKPDGEYVDAKGNSALFDKYVFNYNLSIGVRLFGGYKWRNFNVGQVAQGHNSAFVDEDGRAYMVFHTRTTNGTEGHYVKVHQLFLNKEGWLVAAPYQTTGEVMKESGYSMPEIAGKYEMITHDPIINYASLETKKPEIITLNEDGTISGTYTGTWGLEAGTPYITLSYNGHTYSGVTLSMNIENTTIGTMVFTAMGTDNQITVWGSRVVE